MHILDTLRRKVGEYDKKYRRYPGRILLMGESAQAMADYISQQQHEKRRDGTLAWKFGERTEDEVFLEGDRVYFKRIPVIAELEPERELIVE